MKKILIVIGIAVLARFLFTGSDVAVAAIQFDASSTKDVPGGTSSTIAWTHTSTVAANTPLLFVVSLTRNEANHASAQSVTMHDFKGNTTTTFTKAVSLDDSTNNNTAELWYATSSPTNATTTITINLPTVCSTGNACTGVASTYTGVDMTNPLNATSSAFDRVSGSASASARVTSTANSLVTDSIQINLTETLTPGSNQTLLVSKDNFGGQQGQSYQIATSSVNTITSWTFGSTQWNLVAANFNAAPQSTAAFNYPNPNIVIDARITLDTKTLFD